MAHLGNSGRFNRFRQILGYQKTPAEMVMSGKETANRLKTRKGMIGNMKAGAELPAARITIQHHHGNVASREQKRPATRIQRKRASGNAQARDGSSQIHIQRHQRKQKPRTVRVRQQRHGSQGSRRQRTQAARIQTPERHRKRTNRKRKRPNARIHIQCHQRKRTSGSRGTHKNTHPKSTAETKRFGAWGDGDNRNLQPPEHEPTCTNRNGRVKNLPGSMTCWRIARTRTH